jgi:cytochrome c oxidase subunit II
MKKRIVAGIIGAAALAIGSGRPDSSGVALAKAEVHRAGADDQVGGSEVMVDVTAERFSFTPSEIKVKAGTRLQIRLSSEDTDHGFRIPGTEIDVRIPKRNRGTTTVTFEAAKPGRYTFQCSHVCGAGHSFMRGEIVVTE